MGKKISKKEILEYFNSSEDKYKREAEIVTEEMIKDPLCYNLYIGGRGGAIDHIRIMDKNNGKIRSVLKSDPILKTDPNCIVINVMDKNGIYYCVRKDNPRYLSGELVNNLKNSVIVIDKTGNKFLVGKDDQRYINGDLKSPLKDTVAIKNEDGECIYIPKKSFNKNIHNGIIKNKINVKDSSGNMIQVDKNDDRYLNGDLVGVTKNTFKVYDKNDNIIMITKDDPRYLSGELVGCNKNRVNVIDKNGNKFQVYKNDPRYLSGELVGITKSKVLVIDENKHRFYINKNDPRYLSGDLKSVVSQQLKIKTSDGDIKSILKDEYTSCYKENTIKLFATKINRDRSIFKVWPELIDNLNFKITPSSHNKNINLFKSLNIPIEFLNNYYKI